MKIAPLGSEPILKLGSKLRRISKDLQNEVVLGPSVKSSSLIVLGNGDPDDQVIAILCHHLDGERIVCIAKPEPKRMDALRKLPVYVGRSRFERIVLVLDQEKDKLDYVFSKCEEVLRDVGVAYELTSDAERLRNYDCRLGARIFTLIVVVSGLGDPAFEKHNVEEHLILAAKRLGLSAGGSRDPKEVWRSLQGSERMNVLRSLFERRNFAREIFRQHWDGLEQLKSS